MVHKVFLIRHGETRANRTRVIQGQTHDTPLTSYGFSQMQKVVDFLEDVGIHEPLLWHSTQDRAVQSARLIHKALGGRLTPCEELIQRSWGSMEGKVIGKLNQRKLTSPYYGEPGNGLPPDSEPLSSVQKRLTQFTRTLLKSKGDTHIIVSHNETINYLLNLWERKWLRKRHIMTGEVLYITLTGKRKKIGQSHSLFPQRTIVVRDDAAKILEYRDVSDECKRHDIKITKNNNTSSPENVVAIILGDSTFGLREASRFRNLRAVARFGTGIDAVRVTELQKLGISFSHTAEYATTSVAEYILGISIVMLRDAFQHAAGLRQKPMIWRMINHPGKELHESTIGIIGCGKIGFAVAKLFRAFGSEVIVYNRSWPAHLMRICKLLKIKRATSAAQVYRRCDVISVHIALNSETKNFVGNTAINTIKTGGRRPIFINTARGGLVDERALLNALNSNIIRFAAIDVWSTERENESDVVKKLRRHPHVFPTPHISSFTASANRRAVHRCIDNVIAAIEGRDMEAKEFVLAGSESIN